MADEDEARGLTVGQMAATTGVSAHTLRYYERAGLIQPVARNSGNQRRYRAADVEWVRFLLRLRETGMPIVRMRDYADLRARGAGTVGPRLELLTEHQRELREQIERLRAHEAALEAKVAAYQLLLGAPPDGAHDRDDDTDEGQETP